MIKEVHKECLDKGKKVHKEGLNSCLERGKRKEERCLEKAEHTKNSKNALGHVLIRGFD